jgi:hypothetical protein
MKDSLLFLTIGFVNNLANTIKDDKLLNEKV